MGTDSDLDNSSVKSAKEFRKVESYGKSFDVLIEQADYLKLAEDLFLKCLDVLKSKNHDYAGTEDFFKNFELSEKLGVTSTEKGMMVRLLDKMQRICNGISGKGFYVKDEKIFDTIEDAINYLCLLHMYLSSHKIKE